jgi:prevent-host-death family protein
MLHIRPVSDLRNRFTEIQKTVEENEPVFLTKNGYGTMVVMSMERFSKYENEVELSLKEAELEREMTNQRFTHEEVFSQLRERIADGRK